MFYSRNFIETFIIEEVLRQIPSLPKDDVVKKIILNEYFKKTSYSTKIDQQKDLLVKEIIDFFTEVHFEAPLQEQINLMASHRTKIYFYVNEFRGFDIFGNTLLNRTNAGHGTDLLYLFGPTMYKKFFNSDYQSTIRYEYL